MLVLAPAAQAQLSPAEVAALSSFRHGSDPASARERFAGQGARIAEHYLRHTGTPPSSAAYFFVLETVADADTALALIRGLAKPPEPESGPQFESRGRLQRLPRYEGEIEAALEAVLSVDKVAADPRVAQALVAAVEAMRRTGMAPRAAALLGKCRSEEARQALRRLAADSDANIRSVSLAALGAAGVAPDVELLARALTEDREPHARIEAAAAIAKLKAPEAAPVLRRALAVERQRQVVDALVQGLAALGALPSEPQQCLDVAARTWEISAGALALGCWRAQASREVLVQAALKAQPNVRALAFAALFQAPAPLRELPLVRLAPAPAPSPAPAFDADTRRRLLDSAVQVLSRAVRGHLPRAEAVSSSVAERLNALLYDIAGGDVRLALEHTDRIVTRLSRSPNDGRLDASRALAARDARVYAAVRAPRQAALAAALAACALLLLAFPPARGAALAAALPLGAWAAWSLATDAVRELPPLALAPLTITGSAAVTAALVAPAAALWRGRGWALLACVAAPLAAFFVCGAARWWDVFPVDGEGWGLIFEPIGAALVALPLTLLGCAGAAAATIFLKKEAR